MTLLTRNEHYAEKIVFIDGLPGSGKTLFSQLIASFSRVELLSYAYEIEHICSLHHLEKIPLNAAAVLIRIQTDLKLYDTMMGRNVNFRSSDLSSATNNHDPARYLNRLSGPGDKEIPQIIKKQKPVLNIALHNILGFSAPIWEALDNRCNFIEVIRHPLYMIRQQALNIDSMVGSPRDFSVYYSSNGREFPFYVKEWEENFINQNSYERAISFINYYNNRVSFLKKGNLKKQLPKILTIPFELFVLNPQPWIKKIEQMIQIKALDVTKNVMIQQKIPRKKVADGIDLEIYRRCGWVPPKEDTSERQELNIRREEVLMNISPKMATVLDKICEDYEQNYWCPDE